jgi:hypothetical protein
MRKHLLAIGLAVAMGLGAVAPLQASSVVAEWNEQMLQAVRETGPRPTVVSRSLYIVSAAQYDAWAAYDETALAITPANRGLRQPSVSHHEENRRVAVSYAAYYTLVDQFPSRVAQFEAFMAELGLNPSDDSPLPAPSAVGRAAAQAVLASRENDNSNQVENFIDQPSQPFPTYYTPINSADPLAANAPGNSAFNPNHWQPLRVPTGTVVDANGIPIVDPEDPSSFVDQKFLTPHWGSVTPAAIADPRELLPPAPPQRGSNRPYVDGLGQVSTEDQAWNRQFDEVLFISANLTDQFKVIAEFWADGPRSETPPGHWNQLAQGVSVRDDHDIGQDARMFLALNTAVMDAGIATWFAKRVYDFIRPASAIRDKYAGQLVQAWGGPDRGTQTISGEEWLPYQDLRFVTPPFSEFTSGHSGFSAAAAGVLTAFTGSEAFYDGVTRIGKDLNGDGEEDFLGEHIALPGSNNFESSPAETVVLRWPTFKDAADEAGISRLYGGIHIQDGDLRGRVIGEQVAQAVIAKLGALFAGNRPIEGALSGSWYHPMRSGEGFMLEFIDDGRLVVSWYTYDAEGNQVWLFGDGPVDSNGVATANVVITDGARFGAAFDPDDVNRVNWGTLTFRFTDCDHGSVSYAPVVAGFESGTLQIERLTNLAGQACTD